MTVPEVPTGTDPPATRRRGRPRALTREQVVEAALRLVDEHGVAQLTTGRLARALGVAVVTIYSYVADREELLDAIVERAVRDIPLPAPVPGDPRTAVREQWITYRAVLLSHPGACELITRSVRSVDQLFNHIEASLALLAEAGVGPARAVRAHTALLTYTSGFVQWELARTHERPPGDYAAAVHRLLGALDPDRYRRLVSAADTFATAPTDDGFLVGLDALLDGFGIRYGN